jgi:hypothetical protein
MRISSRYDAKTTTAFTTQINILGGLPAMASLHGRTVLRPPATARSLDLSHAQNCAWNSLPLPANAAFETILSAQCEGEHVTSEALLRTLAHLATVFMEDAFALVGESNATGATLIRQSWRRELDSVEAILRALRRAR